MNRPTPAELHAAGLVDLLAPPCPCAACVALGAALDEHLARIRGHGDPTATRRAVRLAAAVVDRRHGLPGDDEGASMEGGGVAHGAARGCKARPFQYRAHGWRQPRQVTEARR